MKEIILEVWIGIVIGFISFHASKIFSYAIYEPLSSFDKIRAEISSDIIYFANIYSNVNFFSKDDLVEVSKHFRKHSSMLGTYWFKSRIFHLLNENLNQVTKSDIDNAQISLMGFSNSISSQDYSDKDKQIKEIKKLLKLSS